MSLTNAEFMSSIQNILNANQQPIQYLTTDQNQTFIGIRCKHCKSRIYIDFTSLFPSINTQNS